jgi:predicted RNase H-like HicB family nuclease
MRYAVVIERAGDNFSAYVPDLPGCIASGETVAAVESEIRNAIRFHIDGLQADGLAVRLRPASRNTSKRESGKTTTLPQFLP